ncbi:PAS domain-containing protein [Magnetospirillum sulfuroxidans]|uniref:histidine kinase n=1 Tax=Magnetospirillum sulfuroxidans TaxID=611300 RepID=A0ABS5IHN7_9PROT|nr:PAS domain-containing protein [Magnetospirillum sulfuroxidans]MBR9973218.1 PAS domain-containing protein [Magnetospirillum sulfuroxidans]
MHGRKAGMVDGMGSKGLHPLKLFLPLATLIIAVALFISSVLIGSDLDRIATQRANLVRSGMVKLGDTLRVPLHHLLSLPNERQVRAAIEMPTPTTLAGMAEGLLTLLQRNPQYDQARWLDERGQERVRIERGAYGGAPVVVPATKLQNKADRTYFTKTAEQDIGTVYTSEFDLNVENGKIEVPFKPALRIATPVADRTGTRRGIIIVNILGQPALDAFNRVVNADDNHVMLLNQGGYWLSSPDAGDSWGFMFGRTETFATRYPEIWKRITQAETGQILDASGLWNWQTVTAETAGRAGANRQDEPYWRVVSHLPADKITAVILGTAVVAASITLSLLIIVGIMSWQLAARSRLRLEALEARAKAEAEAEERQRKLVELERAQRVSATLNAIVDSSEDAVISKTLDGVITSWNPGAERLFGFAADEAIGRAMTILFPRDMEHEERQILERLAKGEAVSHFETVRRHKDGHLIPVSVTISPIRDAEGRVVGASKIARDISEAKKIQAELERHRAHLESLVDQRTAQLSQTNDLLCLRDKFITTVTDNLPGMVGYWDRDLRCRFANRAYVEWFGKPSQQILGRSMHELLGEAFCQESQPLITAVLAGETQQFERSVTTASGASHFVLAYYIPDFDGDSVIGFFVLVTNVTPIKQAEVELRTANEKLSAAYAETKAADLAKSQFLANMSHEIRTPMNAILGFAEVLRQDSEISPKSARYVQTILHSAQALLAIINDILDVSKLESGKFALEVVSFHLPNALADVLNLVEQRAAENSLQIVMEYDVGLPVRVMGDPTRLRQVILNLVGNAIKFTPKGGVHITIQAAEQPEMMHFCVTDTGIGMTAEQLSKVFQPFSQADASTTRRFGGTGLGTTISKQIVEMMQGRIWAESEYGKGAAFHFTAHLPAAPEGMKCLYEDGGASTVGYVSPRLFKVLLAEDIEVNATLAMLRLREQGHQVDWVKTGREAVAAYEADSYDLVLMDVMMPDMDGLEATRRIRALEAQGGPPISILALTASVMREDNEKCIAAGMDGIEAKPIDFGRLFATIEQTVPKGVGQPCTVLRSEFIAPTQALDFSGLDGVADLEKALLNWRIPEAYAKALISFAGEHGDSVAAIERLLFDTPDSAEPARALLHALKGVAGNLALNKIADLAASIDSDLKAKNRAKAAMTLPALQAALRQAVDAIANLARQDGESNHAPDSATAEAVRQLLLDLLVALESLDPDRIEPVFDTLSQHLPKAKLTVIGKRIEAFDFDAAAAETRRLAADLGARLD